MRKRLIGILLSLALMLTLMPAFGLSQTAYADIVKDYPLWVDGVHVTSENASDVLKDKKVSYDYDTNTLTLKGANITMGYSEVMGKCGIYYSGSGTFKIELSPNTANNIGVSVGSDLGYGIFVKAGLEISGKGTLDTRGSEYGIYSGDTLKINGGTVDAAGGSIGICSIEDIILSSGSVTASGTGKDSVGIFSDGGDVTIENDAAVCASGVQSGIESSAKNITITGGSVTAAGSVCGIAATKSITISNGTVIAKDADYGIGAGGGILISGGNVTAAGKSCGIGFDGGVLTISGGSVNASGESAGIIVAKDGAGINITGGKVTASGTEKAIDGIVRNSIEGTGWTNTEGTKGETAIGLSSESGQLLSVYKKVQFPKPAATVKTVPAALDLTENGSPQELVTAGKAEGGEIQYALGKDSTNVPADGWDRTIPKGTDAGVYYVWYKAVGDKTHSDSEAACVKVTIAKKADPAPAPDPGDPTPAPSDPAAVGSVHKVGAGTYVVKSANTIWLKKVAKNRKSFTVPAIIKIKGKKYSVTGINAKAFKGTKVKTLYVKTKKLTKKSVRASLKGSKVRTIKIRVGKAKENKKYVKNYKKIFTKKNAGKKVSVK